MWYSGLYVNEWRIMRPKDYLYSKGLIDNPKQRGRLSLAHKEIIEQAVRDGVQIDGYSVAKSTAPVKDDGTSVPKVERVEKGGIVDIGDETRPEKSWQAHYMMDGEKVMRTVCNTCNSSLTYCHCRTPYVWHDHERQGLVQFSLRKDPLPVNPWS
jgi:hypothetical protein